ncbi:AraC family transcriptional regulator [Curtobacterium sp. Csp1]|uniref:AraC family transcriptional regulator n=1 Tax=Curtobacterium sp. Csp1 TaxID=2495429 RepID=UPI00159A4B34|nr:helix-turn-helix transcriptional regulator [Curtobacterium sp. Csp1]QKS21311.1 AraC family transcriptional regulator [Curtobacterium sp. Csp1]
MSIDTPIDPRTRFETAGTDLGAALDMFGQAYEGAGFVGGHTDRPFSYRFRVVGDDVMSFRSTVFDARAAGQASSGDEYVVVWTSEGGGVIGSGQDEVRYGPGTPVVFPTDGPFAFDLQDVRQSLVHFDKRFLEGVASEVHGGSAGPLVFDQAARPRREDLQTWNAQVQRAASTILGSGPVSPIAMAETARATALAMLHTFPHRQLACPDGDRVHARVRPHPDLDHGRRRARVGTAPNAMLRGVRMDRVREELLRGAPGQLTVAEVAVRWGFAHLGRFSAAYHQRFGEYPRDTLQR